jgi:hypothetical protein
VASGFPRWQWYWRLCRSMALFYSTPKLCHSIARFQGTYTIQPQHNLKKLHTSPVTNSFSFVVFFSWFQFSRFSSTRNFSDKINRYLKVQLCTF